jgi:hypothetical protein
MLAQLYYLFRPSSVEEEILHPLDCQALQPASHAETGPFLPFQEEPATLPAALDKLVEVSQDIMRRIDSLTAQVEQLREDNAARRSKRRRLGKAQSAGVGGTAMGAQEPVLGQNNVGQQAEPYLQQGGENMQSGETKGRRCGICREPGHNALTCQKTRPNPNLNDGAADC